VSVPLRQSLVVARYLARQRLRRNDKFPLLVELEPLFQCNLSCSFCGKIQHPDHVLRQRMPVERALAAIEESGAPMVSIAGGEPLVHPEVHVIARARDRQDVYALRAAGAADTVRETFEGSVRAGERALAALGWDADEVAAIARAFVEEDERLLAELEADWDPALRPEENPAFSARALEREREIEALLARTKR
jgi:hypothetical protein